MSITEFLEEKRKGKTDDDFQKYLKKIISKLLEDKRYLVIVDDIWDWKDWEFIRNDTLPKINNLRCRIISTTRYNAIAEKYLLDNNSFVYKIEGLSPVAATALSERVFKKSGKVYNILCDIQRPCSSIAKMTRGMPLAIICMSSALAEQLSVQDGQAIDLEQFHVAERQVLEGFLTIQCLRPLVESFSHGYHELSLHLKTCLLHCCIYPPYHIFGRNDLIWIWIAEGFVHEEEEAQSYIDQLINTGFIWPHSSTTTPVFALKYEIDVMMLHFLRCKAHEDYFVASLDRWSDVSHIPATPPVLRLCIQCYRYNVDISGLHVSDIRFLYVFDYMWMRISSLKHFEHLQILYLHGGHLTNADLEDICGLVGLRWLSLRVELINQLPKEIRRLQNLKTLDVSNTGISSLPKEIGELKCLETLDVSNTMLTELPMDICRLQQLKTLNARNSCVRELPKEITELQHLETLDISYTMVVELPREIGELNLKTLNAEGTYIREVCREIGKLDKLEMLNLRNTMITLFPRKIGLLHLKTLDAGGTYISEDHLPEPNVDPRSGFLHKDASELMDMDEKKYQVIRLLEEHHTVCIAGFAGMGKTTLADLVYNGIGKKFESQAFVSLSRRPNMSRVLRSLCAQLMASAITYKRNVVTGSLAGVVVTDWTTHYSVFAQAITDLLCQDIQDNKDAENDFDTIFGFLGCRRDASINTIQVAGAEEKPDLTMSITELLKKKRKGKTDDDFQKYLKKIISKLLEDKRYLVIVDDIGDWKDWEFIRNDTLPKINNLGCRIISTTRYNAIAEKYLLDNNSFVYKIEGLSPVAATALSERVFKKSGKVYNILCDIQSPCSSIAKMTRGMPLAIICMSSALAEQLSVQDGQAIDLEQFHVAERQVLEGFLTIPCLRPLVESLSHGYHELSLHLKTCLLHCCIYPPYHIFGRNDLIWIWIAEGFVHEEEEAQSYIDQLINEGFIWPHSSTTTPVFALKYEIDVMMLHFLRCKAHEDYFVASPDRWSDVSLIPAIPPVLRLCIQRYRYNVDISGLHVSDICFLYVFDCLWMRISSLKHFEHLQILYLHGGHLTNADLEDICGLVGLRWLSLRVELINQLPKEIRRLQNLKTLDVSNTGILGLPKEIGELKRLETLDVSNTMLTELPREIGELNLKTLDAEGTYIREVCKEIGKLDKLEMLNLRNTMITELPTEIGLLHLKTLDAGGTYIRDVCKEIGKLDKLESLDLKSTQVTELPKEIGELLRLKALIVRDTLVTELPMEIGKMQQLEMLDVSGTMLTKLPKELGKLKHLKTLDISNTVVRELPWEAGGISNSVSVLVDDNDPPKVVKLVNNDGCGAWNVNGSLAESSIDKQSIILFDHFGSTMEPLPFARFKIGERHMGLPKLVKNHLKDICSLEISVWKLEEEDFKFLGEMPKLHALALQLESRPRDPITITSKGFLELKSFSIDCRVLRVIFEERAMLKLKYLDFKFYSCRPTEHPMGINHLQSLRSVAFRCGSPRYGSEAPGINAVINQVRKQAQENPNRITFRVNNNEVVYPEKAIKLLEENGESSIIDGASSSSTSGAATGLFSNDIDEEGKLTPVKMYYPFG